MVAPLKLPYVTTLHGTDVTLVGADRSYLPITKFSIEESDAVTAISEYLRHGGVLGEDFTRITMTALGFEVVIGGLTFTGSLMAAAKLLRLKVGGANLPRLDATAWQAARNYAGAGPQATAYANQVLAIAREFAAQARERRRGVTQDRRADVGVVLPREWPLPAGQFVDEDSE